MASDYISALPKCRGKRFIRIVLVCDHGMGLLQHRIKPGENLGKISFYTVLSQWYRYDSYCDAGSLLDHGNRLSGTGSRYLAGNAGDPGVCNGILIPCFCTGIPGCAVFAVFHYPGEGKVA